MSDDAEIKQLIEKTRKMTRRRTYLVVATMLIMGGALSVSSVPWPLVAVVSTLAVAEVAMIVIGAIGVAVLEVGNAKKT